MPTSAHSRHSGSVLRRRPRSRRCTKSAQSAARRPARGSPTKSAYPGVSTRLTLIPSWTTGASARRSNGRAPARTPRSRRRWSRHAPSPRAGPLRHRRAASRPGRSLPELPGPTSATFLIRSRAARLEILAGWSTGTALLRHGAPPGRRTPRQLLLARRHKGSEVPGPPARRRPPRSLPDRTEPPAAWGRRGAPVDIKVLPPRSTPTHGRHRAEPAGKDQDLQGRVKLSAPASTCWCPGARLIP